MKHEEFITNLSAVNVAADDIQQEIKRLFKAVYSEHDKDVKDAAQQLAYAAASLLAAANEIANRNSCNDYDPDK